MSALDDMEIEKRKSDLFLIFLRGDNSQRYKSMQESTTPTSYTHSMERFVWNRRSEHDVHAGLS